MSNLFAKFIATLSAIGLLNTAAFAQSFSSVGEARAYLAQNPTGPRAEEAFKLIVEASLSNKYPGYSPGSSSAAISPASGASREAILRGLAELSGQNSGGGNINQQVY